jgi:hypothetical protein
MQVGCRSTLTHKTILCGPMYSHHKVYIFLLCGIHFAACSLKTKAQYRWQNLMELYIVFIWITVVSVDCACYTACFSTFATSLGHSVYTGTIVQALSWSSRISGRCRGDETSCTTGKGGLLQRCCYSLHSLCAFHPCSRKWLVE